MADDPTPKILQMLSALLERQDELVALLRRAESRELARDRRLQKAKDTKARRSKGRLRDTVKTQPIVVDEVSRARAAATLRQYGLEKKR